MTVLPEEVGAETIMFSERVRILGRHYYWTRLNWGKGKKWEKSG